MAQCKLVMGPQGFHVQDLETGFLHGQLNIGNAGQLAIGKDIGIDEPADGRILPAGIVGDAVVQEQATWPEQPPHLAEIGRKVFYAYVLEHADTDDAVIARILRQFAIVQQLDLHLLLQAFAPHPLAGMGTLLPAQGDAMHPDPMVSRSPDCKRAPATTDIQQMLAR